PRHSITSWRRVVKCIGAGRIDIILVEVSTVQAGTIEILPRIAGGESANFCVKPPRPEVVQPALAIESSAGVREGVADIGGGADGGAVGGEDGGFAVGGVAVAFGDAAARVGQGG